MKTILAAAALAFAFPAAAQTAPAAGHEHHQKHGQADHAAHGKPSGSEKHEKCDMSDEECRKRCAKMHGDHKAGGEHAGHKPNG